LLAGRSRADATLEIELVDDITGDTWTPLQVSCTVREDVIPNTPASQTAGPVYLLESVANDRFPRVDAVDALSSAQKQQVFENLGFTSYADLTAANTALAAGRIYYDISLATLHITTA
jgi:hypothetical protein